ncbi:hypothetical protein [Streptomyces zhihengii]|uniref:FAD-dependent oxidoreductase n=1 Tax=Streptomyces zhihengii TaxID=1818004 RepID=A0ABS2V2D7_9ACTN|nr:hypothetical protein [Streptomyces zhihengii]MBM9623619.1 hypothetical protein [Streptomyces zhihengii]
MPVPRRDRLTVREAPGVAVVGGGIAGLSAAVLPAERGARPGGARRPALRPRHQVLRTLSALAVR